MEEHGLDSGRLGGGGGGHCFTTHTSSRRQRHPAQLVETFGYLPQLKIDRHEFSVWAVPATTTRRTA
jgi:hypothetical protein